MNTLTTVIAAVLVVGMGILAFFAERGGKDLDESEDEAKKDGK